MARREGNFLKGVVGKVVLKVVRGKQHVVPKPERGAVKQTVATKAAATVFGKASSLGAGIREIFEINNGSYFDSTVNSRLVSVIRDILTKCENPVTKAMKFTTTNFKSLTGFDFNKEALMEKHLRFKPGVKTKDGVMQIAFDNLSVASQFKFPAKTFKCVVSLSLAVFNLKEGLLFNQVNTQHFKVDKNMKTVPAQTFSFDLPAGCLCLVRMSLEFFVAGKSTWKHVTAANANPSTICAAVITPGVLKKAEPRYWLSRENFKMA